MSLNHLDNKYPNYFKYLFTLVLILWGSAVIDRVFLWQTPDVINKIVSGSAFYIHCCILFISFRILYHTKKSDKNLLFWFIATNLGLFLTDSYFYYIMYLHNNYKIHVGNMEFYIDLITYYIWIISIIIFSVKIIKKYILHVKFKREIIWIMISFNVIVILLFILSAHYANQTFSLATISQIISFIVLMLGFDAITLCLICAENIGFILYMLGIIAIMAMHFSLVYRSISQQVIMLPEI